MIATATRDACTAAAAAPLPFSRSAVLPFSQRASRIVPERRTRLRNYARCDGKLTREQRGTVVPRDERGTRLWRCARCSRARKRRNKRRANHRSAAARGRAYITVVRARRWLDIRDGRIDADAKRASGHGDPWRARIFEARARARGSNLPLLLEELEERKREAIFRILAAISRPTRSQRLEREASSKQQRRRFSARHTPCVRE